MSSTNLLLNLQTRKQVAFAAAVTLAGVTYFALIIVALHFLRPELNPISQPTSRYAIGPYGFLMTTAFFSMSVASLALVVGLYQSVAQPARSPMGFTLLGLWGIGVLIAMIFPMDVEGAPQSLAGTIHQISGPLTFLCVTVAVNLLSWRLRLDDSWRPTFRIALILSLFLLAGYIATFLSFVTGSGLTGVAQRVTLAVLSLWMFLAASRLLTRH